MTRTRLALVLLLALPACGDDDDVGPTLQQRMQKLGSCTPTDVVVLLPWTGPAFDDTGKLRAPLPAGHVEAVVNGWRRYDAASTRLREQQGNLVAQDVFARPGLLGFQSVESVECDISMSHTLWQDEAAMLAFVAGPAHASAMAQTPQMHHVAEGAHWSNEARSVAPTWQQGITRLVAGFR